jgi:hypothetical protein
MKKVVSFLLSVALVLALAVAAPKTVKAAYSISNPPFLAVARESSLSHITVGWTGISDADGYQVYMKRTTAAKFSKVATVKGLTYVSKSLSTDAYQVKVRAYKKENGKTVYSPFSSVKTVETGLIDYSSFGVGILISEKELPELLTMVGDMKKVSSKAYPTYAAKGNGISVGYKNSGRYPDAYFFMRVKGNLGFYIGGIRCGYDKVTALSVAGDFSSDDDGKTFYWMSDRNLKLVPTYNKNGVITEMVLTASYSG